MLTCSFEVVSILTSAIRCVDVIVAIAINFLINFSSFYQDVVNKELFYPVDGL